MSLDYERDAMSKYIRSDSQLVVTVKSIKKKLTFPFILLFILFWLAGFTSSLFAGRCLNEDIDIKDRLRTCSVASKTTLSKYFEADHDAYARIEFERIIALAETGKLEKSASAMSEFLKWANIDKTWKRHAADKRSRKIADVIFPRVQKLDRNGNSFAVFARVLGF